LAEEVSQTVEGPEEDAEGVYPDGIAMLQPLGGEASVKRLSYSIKIKDL